MGQVSGLGGAHFDPYDPNLSQASKETRQKVDFFIQWAEDQDKQSGTTFWQDKIKDLQHWEGKNLGPGKSAEEVKVAFGQISGVLKEIMEKGIANPDTWQGEALAKVSEDYAWLDQNGPSIEKFVEGKKMTASVNNLKSVIEGFVRELSSGKMSEQDVENFWSGHDSQGQELDRAMKDLKSLKGLEPVLNTAGYVAHIIGYAVGGD